MLHLELAVDAFVAKTTFVILAWLIGGYLRSVLSFGNHMAKHALTSFLAYSILLEKLAYGELLLDKRMYEITFFISFSTISLHPVDAHLLLGLGLISLLVDRFGYFNQFLDTFILQF